MTQGLIGGALAATLTLLAAALLSDYMTRSGRSCGTCRRGCRH
jgi:hypothetical protein